MIGLEMKTSTPPLRQDPAGMPQVESYADQRPSSIPRPYSLTGQEKKARMLRALHKYGPIFIGICDRNGDYADRSGRNGDCVGGTGGIDRGDNAGRNDDGHCRRSGSC